MIVSHRSHDEGAFTRNAEAIIRSLNVQNRPSDAVSLRNALRVTNGKHSRANGNGNSGPTSLSRVSQLPSSMITITETPKQKHLVVAPESRILIDRICREHHCSGKLRQAGLFPSNRLLFWGPPGCGKTAAAEWLASSLSILLGVVRLASLITSYVGETGANLQKVLQYAEQNPMVLLLDEADAIAKSRDDKNDVGELRRVVNSLLQMMDSFAGRPSIVILASNHTHLMDSAIWRRFDDIVAFPMPGEKERLELLQHLTSGLTLKGSLATLARKLSGASYAELEKAVHEVTRAAVISGQDVVPISAIADAVTSWQAKLRSAQEGPIGVSRNK